MVVFRMALVVGLAAFAAPSCGGSAELGPSSEEAIRRAEDAEAARDELAVELDEVTAEADAAASRVEVLSKELVDAQDRLEQLESEVQSASSTSSPTTASAVPAETLDNQYRQSVATNLGVDPADVRVPYSSYDCGQIQDIIDDTDDAKSAQYLLDLSFGRVDSGANQKSKVEKLITVDVYCPELFDAMWELYAQATPVLQDGTFEVGPGIPAGAYTITDRTVKDCYWERTAANGDIIDNNFITAANNVSVTVHDGELFTSQGCGVWTAPPLPEIVIQRVNA